MGGARADDGPQALRSAATLARLADALRRVEVAHAELRPCPGQGFEAAVGPLRHAWATTDRILAALLHHASTQGGPETLQARREGLASVEALRHGLESSPELFACVSQSAAESLNAAAAREAMLAMLRRAGTNEQTRRAVTRCRGELGTLCGAFAEHHGHPTEQALRASWRAAQGEAERAEAWHALHQRGRDREILVRDILALRREWATAVGEASFASMQCRDSALTSASAIQQWLAPRLTALRSLTQRDTSPLGTQGAQHPSPRPLARRVLRARADVQARLHRLLQPWVATDARLAFDLGPRPDKHAGTWTSVFTTPEATRQVTICASLPERLTHAHVRSLLHEAGHAAEFLARRDPAAPLCEPDRDRMEVASIWFERAAWDPQTLRRLGVAVDAPTLAADRRAQEARPRLHQFALASTDIALHHDFDPRHDGSPLAWARRVLSIAEGRERDPADCTVAMHAHLFSHPRGYAARYLAYPLAETVADALLTQHGPGLPTSEAFAAALARTRVPAQWSQLIGTSRAAGGIEPARGTPV